MKVTLVSPYASIQSNGTRILSACLKQKGHDVQLIFLPKIFKIKYRDEVLNEFIELSKDSDLIGITLMSNYFQNAVQLSQKLRDNLSAPILWGGIHPTIRPEECLNYADMICIGEGEESIVELTRKMENGQNYHDIQGMWFKDNGKIIKNIIRPLIQDLASVPFQDFDYETHYILDGNRILKMTEKLLHLYLGTSYRIFPTRGCPFGCTYCCNNTLNKMYRHQKMLRKRSIDNIVKELMEVKKKLPFIKHIMFDDDAFFMYSEKEIGKFCEEYKQKINMPLFVRGGHPKTVTKEKLSLLVDAGLEGIRIGIQTFAKRTKELYKRRYSNEQIENAVKIIHEFKDKLSYPPNYDIILDNPWETEEDLIETLMFLTRFPTPYHLDLFSLILFPETELYKKAKKEGIITDDIQDIYCKDFLTDFSKSYLNKLFHMLNIYNSSGHRISTKMMSLLVNRKLRPFKSRFFYVILKIWAFIFRIQEDFRFFNFIAIKDKDWYIYMQKFKYEVYIKRY